MQVANTLAYVRLSSGGTVQLGEGDAVPDDADPEHVAHLTARGVLGEAEPAPEPDPRPRGGKPRSGD